MDCGDYACESTLACDGEPVCNIHSLFDNDSCCGHGGHAWIAAIMHVNRRWSEMAVLRARL